MERDPSSSTLSSWGVSSEGSTDDEGGIGKTEEKNPLNRDKKDGRVGAEVGRGEEEEDASDNEDAADAILFPAAGDSPLAFPVGLAAVEFEYAQRTLAHFGAIKDISPAARAHARATAALRAREEQKRLAADSPSSRSHSPTPKVVVVRAAGGGKSAGSSGKKQAAEKIGGAAAVEARRRQLEREMDEEKLLPSVVPGIPTCLCLMFSNGKVLDPDVEALLSMAHGLNCPMSQLSTSLLVRWRRLYAEAVGATKLKRVTL